MKKLSGQITVEAAIVTPVVMMIVASLIYLSFYIHDVIAIKSYAYSIGNRKADKEITSFEKDIREKLKEVPLLVMLSDANCVDNGSSYTIEIVTNPQREIKWMDKLLNVDDSRYYVQIEKDMEFEKMYAFRAICDVLRDKKE